MEKSRLLQLSDLSDWIDDDATVNEEEWASSWDWERWLLQFGALYIVILSRSVGKLWPVWRDHEADNHSYVATSPVPSMHLISNKLSKLWFTNGVSYSKLFWKILGFKYLSYK